MELLLPWAKRCLAIRAHWLCLVTARASDRQQLLLAAGPLSTHTHKDKDKENKKKKKERRRRRREKKTSKQGRQGKQASKANEADRADRQGRQGGRVTGGQTDRDKQTSKTDRQAGHALSRMSG